MKVKELISILNTLSKNKDVYLSSDPEGNSYGTIHNRSIFEDDNFYIIAPFEEGLYYEDLEERSNK